MGSGDELATHWGVYPTFTHMLRQHLCDPERVKAVKEETLESKNTCRYGCECERACKLKATVIPTLQTPIIANPPIIKGLRPNFSMVKHWWQRRTQVSYTEYYWPKGNWWGCTTGQVFLGREVIKMRLCTHKMQKSPITNTFELSRFFANYVKTYFWATFEIIELFSALTEQAATHRPAFSSSVIVTETENKSWYLIK